MTLSGLAFEALVHSSDRERWLEARRTGLGSSDAPAAVGVNPWRSRLQLYAEKLGLEPPGEQSEPAFWGTVLEPHVLERFKRETGREVERDGWLLRSRSRVWQLATLDGVQWAPERDGPGVLEAKCTSLEGRWSEGLPDYVDVQCQHQLAVTGYKWGSVAVLFNGREFFWLDFERDEEKIAWINSVEAAFWSGIQKLEPPDPIGTDDDRKTIARLYPKELAEKAEPVLLDGTFVELDERRDEVRADLKRLQAEELEIENRLKLAIGEHAAAILPNGVSYTLKSQTRKAYEVAAATFRVLRRHERGGLR